MVVAVVVVAGEAEIPTGKGTWGGGGGKQTCWCGRHTQRYSEGGSSDAAASDFQRSSESLSQLGPIAATATLDGGEFLVGLLDGDEAPFGVASLRLGGRVNLVWMILAHQLPIALRQLLL